MNAFAAFVLFEVPMVGSFTLLSGVMFPFRAMPVWAQWIGEVLPLTHFLRIVRGILLKGNTAAQLLPELWPMLAFLFVTGVIALKRYRQTLD